MVTAPMAHQGETMSGNHLVARWESGGGAHYVELWKQAGSGWCYRANGAGGYLGNDFTSDGAALEYFEPQVGRFQPDANKRPMRRVS